MNIYLLDFAKTGIFATMNSELVHYPYPDFMKQRPLKTFTSTKPLGVLYRSTKSMHQRHLSNTDCFYDPRMHVEDMYKYIIEARKTKAKYDHSLRILLGQYSVKTEIEFISGHIIDWPKYLNEQYRPLFLEQIKVAYIRFRKYWKKVFNYQWTSNINATENQSNNKDQSAQIEAKAAAWYYVTYHPSEFKSDVIYNNTLQRYMSFPWVAENYLIYIAHKNDSRPNLAEFSQAISPEKIENHAKLHISPNTKIMFAESDDEDEYEDESDESSSEYEDKDANNGEQTLSEHQPTNTYDLDLPRHPQEIDHDEDIDDVPVVNVKFADLLKL